MTNNSKLLYIVETFLVLIVLFLILKNFLVGSFIQLDDVCSLSSNIIPNFNGLFPYGNYMAALINNIIGAYIPIVKGLHPSYYKSVYFSYIEAFFFICFILTYTLILYRKLDKYFSLAILTSYSILYYCFYKQIYFYLFVYTNIVRWEIPLFLWACLFLLLILNIENKKNIYILPISILTMLCCVLNEMVCITTMVGFILYYCNQEKGNKNKILILYIMITILGFIFSAIHGMYTRYNDINTINISYLINIFKIIPEYIVVFIKVIFINHIVEYIIIAMLVLIINKKCQNNITEKEIINLSLSFVFASLFFLFMLVFIGKKPYGDDGYWICQKELIITLSIINCTCIIALFNVVLKKNILKEVTKYIVFICIPITLFILFYNQYTYEKERLKNNEIATYKAEKIIRIANLKNKIAYLDEKLLEDYLLWQFFKSFEDREKNKIYDSISYIEILNQFEKENPIKCKIVYTDAEKVEKEFKNNGGFFTSEELENPNFNKLLDKNFLLNNYSELSKNK